MQELVPVLRQAFPDVSDYDTLATVVQANAEGRRVILKQSTADKDGEDTDVFVKQVDASNYASKKAWPDFRRTMMYLRTEVRFYNVIEPDLRKRGFTAAPKIYHAECDLSGLIDEDEKATDQSHAEPTDWSANGKGGSMIMESIVEPHYFQDSPLTLDQAKETLSAVATLHASAWEDAQLLQKAHTWLSRGSYHLKTRNVKELAGMEQAWENFTSNFGHLRPSLFERTRDIGSRIKGLAEYISEEVSPGPKDPYATLSHGDFKAMNCFLPRNTDANSARGGVVIVDYASTGVGLGMSDVAMHINHAVLPELLENGGEEALIDHYLQTLNDQLGPNRSYPRDIAMKHYRLAVADYFRFFLGRFWKSATLESFAQKKDSKNTALVNRHVEAALAFLDRVDRYLRQIEEDHTVSQ